MMRKSPIFYGKERYTLPWRQSGSYCVSNQQPHDCLLNCLFRRRSKKTSKLRVTSLCARNSPVTGVFLAQKGSNAKNVSIRWRHHGILNNKQFNPCGIPYVSKLMNALLNVSSSVMFSRHLAKYRWCNMPVHTDGFVEEPWRHRGIETRSSLQRISAIRFVASRCCEFW